MEFVIEENSHKEYFQSKISPKSDSIPNYTATNANDIVTGKVPLSSCQSRMWLLSLFAKGIFKNVNANFHLKYYFTDWDKQLVTAYILRFISSLQSIIGIIKENQNENYQGKDLFTKIKEFLHVLAIELLSCWFVYQLFPHQQKGND